MYLRSSFFESPFVLAFSQRKASPPLEACPKRSPHSLSEPVATGRPRAGKTASPSGFIPPQTPASQNFFHSRDADALKLSFWRLDSANPNERKNVARSLILYERRCLLLPPCLRAFSQRFRATNILLLLVAYFPFDPAGRLSLIFCMPRLRLGTFSSFFLRRPHFGGRTLLVSDSRTLPAFLHASIALSLSGQQFCLPAPLRVFFFSLR